MLFKAKIVTEDLITVEALDKKEAEQRVEKIVSELKVNHHHGEQVIVQYVRAVKPAKD